MDSNGIEHERPASRPVSRRRFLATGTAVAAAALAGCEGDVASQEYEADLDGREFAADPVVLPEGARDELRMTELARNSRTTTRQIEQVGGEVAITNQFSAYGRATPEEPSLVERFVANAGTSSGTAGDVERPGARVGLGADPAGDAANAAIAAGLPDRHGPMRSASVVTASDVGVDEAALEVFEESPTVSGDEIGLLVPVGLRADEAPAASDVLAMVSGTAIPGSRWLTGERWIPSTNWFPGERWVPGGAWVPDDPTTLRILSVTAEGTFGDRYGTAAEELGGRHLEEGAGVPAENTVVALPGDVLFPGERWNPTDVYDAGYPAPLGGATYGAGVLATPNGRSRATPSTR